MQGHPAVKGPGLVGCRSTCGQVRAWPRASTTVHLATLLLPTWPMRSTGQRPILKQGAAPRAWAATLLAHRQGERRQQP